MRDLGEGAAEVTSTEDIDWTSRVRVLDHRIHAVETRVDAGFAELKLAVSKISDAISAHRQPIPFKEIAATAAVCLGILAYVGNFLERQHEKNVQLIVYRLDQLEKRPPIMVPVPGLTAQR